MRIGRNEIMRIVNASRKDRAPVGDDVVMWLIIGGWMAAVAVLSSLSEIQALLSK